MKKENNKDYRQIKPLNNKILVEPTRREEKTKSGIVIPDTATKERPEEGKVLRVGPGAWDEKHEKRLPVSVKEGDEILFEKYGPKEIKVGEKELLIIKEDDILAVIEK